jgi:hypothetical protein
MYWQLRNGEWLATPPPYPCIQTKGIHSMAQSKACILNCGFTLALVQDSVMNLQQYMNMTTELESAAFGRVYTLLQLMKRFSCSPNVTSESP